MFSLIYLYPSVLAGFVSAWNEILLVVLDANDVFPAAGEAIGTCCLIQDKDVEVTVYRSFGV